MTREENKRAIIETIFWYIALIVLQVVIILIKLLYMHTHGGVPDLIKQSPGIFYKLFANNVFNAFIITLLNNKILKKIMSRVN